MAAVNHRPRVYANLPLRVELADHHLGVAAGVTPSEVRTRSTPGEATVGGWPS
jgi:hypothetical protein